MIALKAGAVLIAAVLLSGCYANQSRALSSCKGSETAITACMERGGYVLDISEEVCSRVREPLRYADCYRPRRWLAAMARRLENTVSPPPEPPPPYHV